jgi:hypothetical protein
MLVGRTELNQFVEWSVWASFNYWKSRAPVIPTIYIYIYKIYIRVEVRPCSNRIPRD